MALRPPRAFLSEEELRALSPEEQAVAVAEWSSYIAGVRIEKEREEREQQDQQYAGRGHYRGGRARGDRGRGRARGRGYNGHSYYHPYPRASHPRTYQNLSTTFNNSGTPSTPSAANLTARAVPEIRNTNGAHETEHLASKVTELCAIFTATGICARSRCHYTHDPDKTAICKPFLFKGSCTQGSSCPLSHEPSPNRSPNCVHFQNDYCNKDNCPYAHVNVNANASVCEAFGRLGYCEKGDQCADRHAFECPDFTNKGSCNAKDCRLPHVVHAGRLRQARKASAEAQSPSNTSSSEKEEDKADDIDHTHALTQQIDFVPFEP